MKRRALLIGSNYADTVHGVEYDLELMAGMLERYDFAIRVCAGFEATRAGIIEQLKRLCRDTQEQDAVVIYYSGHGGLAKNPRWTTERGVREPPYYRCLIPTDFGATNDSSFRGLLAAELSLYVLSITENKTRNVSLVLDCCYAEAMTRGQAGPTARSIGAPWDIGVEAHLEQLRGLGHEPRRQYAESNPHVIRLMACGPRERAHEDLISVNGVDRFCGLMTHAFVETLTARGDMKLLWQQVGRRVRNRVTRRRPSQHPVVHGPIRRLIFSTDESRRLYSLGLTRVLDRWWLEGGYLAGVQRDDRYVIAPIVQDSSDRASGSLCAEVTDVVTHLAAVSLEQPTDHDEVLAGATACPSTFKESRGIVVTVGEAPALRVMTAELTASGYLCATRETDHQDPVAILEIDDNSLALRDPNRALLRPLQTLPFDEEELLIMARYVRVELSRIARAQSFLRLATDTAHPEYRIPREHWSLRWYTVKDGARSLLPEGALTVHDDTEISVEITNHGPTGLYASVFVVFHGGEVRLLSRAYPAGAQIRQDEPYILGERTTGWHRGVTIRWPGAVPNSGEGAPQRATMLAILSSTAVDLRSWETGVALGEPDWRRAEYGDAPGRGSSSVRQPSPTIAPARFAIVGQALLRGADH